jgi:hypothetical protein
MPKAIFLSLFLWAAAIGAVFYTFNSNVPRQQRKFYTFAIVGSAFAIQAGISALANHQRIRAVASTLASRGFVSNFDDNAPPQALHYTPQKDHHSFKPVMSALGVLHDRPAHVAEYTYTIGRGKSARTFRLTEAALDISPATPPFTISRRIGVLKRPITKILSADDSPLITHEAFNKRWASPNLTPEAAALLSPDLLSFLAQAPPTEEQWRAADGWLSCTWQKACTPSELDLLFNRVMTVAHHTERVTA